MSCEKWQVKFDQYVDDELAGNEAAEFQAHLRQCQSCAADALERLRLKRMTHVAGKRYTPRPEFRLQVAQQIANAKKKSAWSWKWGLSWKFATVTALVVAAITVGVLWSGHAQREREFSELADLHVATLASENPVDVVSTDRHTVKPWFAGKLPFTFNVPELQNSPFQLKGGRVAYFEQTPGAQLLLQVNKHQLTVFIFPERSLAARIGWGTTVAHKLGFTIESWQQNGLQYFVISDASPSDVAELSEIFKRAG